MGNMGIRWLQRQTYVTACPVNMIRQSAAQKCILGYKTCCVRTAQHGTKPRDILEVIRRKVWLVNSDIAYGRMRSVLGNSMNSGNTCCHGSGLPGTACSSMHIMHHLQMQSVVMFWLCWHGFFCKAPDVTGRTGCRPFLCAAYR